MTYLCITGTDTGVGKTVVTAAICAVALTAGSEVRVVKPVQTGTSIDEPDDATTIRQLTGHVDVSDLVRLDAPLAPESAARRAGLTLPTVRELADRIGRSAAELTLIEGAGGVLVRLDSDGGTILDLGSALAEGPRPVSYVVVTSLRLGTLNQTELTVNAIRRADHRVAGLVIGSRDRQLGHAEQCNVDDLPRLTGVPILGAIPAGAGQLTSADFRLQAPTWLDHAALIPPSSS